MSNYYKSSKLKLNPYDEIIKLYMDGFKLVNGVKIKIESNHLKTRHNIRFREEIKSLLNEYLSIIAVENLAINLLKPYQNFYRGHIGIFWNLIKSQSSTLRFHRRLLMSVNKHIIDDKNILIAIHSNIKSTQDRAIRNKNLVLEFLDEIGVKVLLLDIADGDIFGHAKNFVFNNLDTYEDNMELAHTSYYNTVLELAKSRNVDIESKIISLLESEYENKKEKVIQVKENIKQTKKDINFHKKIEIITRDNAKIQNAIDSCCISTVEDKERARKLIKYIINDSTINKINKLYYIAYCFDAGNKVYYVSTQTNKATSFSNLLLFTKESDASYYIDRMKEQEKFKDCIIDVCELTI